VLLGLAVLGFLCSIALAVLVARGRHTHPQTTGYAVSGAICLGLMSLATGAYALGDLPGGVVRVILLVLINLVVQPLCLLLFVGGAYKAGMALRGRLTYAFRTISSSDFSPEEFRSLRKHCVIGGAIGVSFSVGLAFVCLRPLVSALLEL
jgi:hypothetical protein